MLKSGARNGSNPRALNRLGEAVAEALDSGVSEEELQTMLKTAVAEHQTGHQTWLPGFPNEGQDTVYDELPPELVDLRTAASEYGCSIHRLRSWVHRGHIKSLGRLRGRAPGGGVHVVSREELMSKLAMPLNKEEDPRN